MTNKILWCGYLEAGEKSTPIITDSSLSTGNDKTLYLYNHARGAILEYQRAIVEPKLRDLNDGEADVVVLKKAYHEVRSEFAPKGGRLQKLAEKASVPVAAKAVSEPEPDLDVDDEDFMDDMDDEDLDD